VIELSGKSYEKNYEKTGELFSDPKGSGDFYSFRLQ